MALEAGDRAPDFTRSDQHGEAVSLPALRGRTVVIYLYPKADTPGSKDSVRTGSGTGLVLRPE